MSSQAKVTVEKVKTFVDPRGVVVEPMENTAFVDQRNAHLVVTVPGGIRGNHFHPRGAETCLVLGPALVRYREDGQTQDVEVAAGEAIRFHFPPGVPHAMKNTGTNPMLLISFNTVAHDPAHPDTLREVLIPS